MLFWLNFLIFSLRVAFFCVRRFIPFLFFYEGVVIPIVVVIVGWGYQFERLQAVEYFLFFIVFFSGVSYYFLFEFISVCFVSSLYDFVYFYVRGLGSILIILVFLVKMPVFGLHFWLPKAHVEAPTVGSMQLAGVLLKLGRYGLKRIVCLSRIFLEKEYVFCFVLFIVILGVCVLFQRDSKKLVGYMSVCHINFLIIFLILIREQIEEVVSFMSFRHGVVSSNLFFIVGEMYGLRKRRIIYFIRCGVLLRRLELFRFLINNMCNIGVPPFISRLVEVKIYSRVLLIN